MSKVHWIEDTETSDWDGKEFVTAMGCGINLERYEKLSCSTREEDVTCKSCLKKRAQEECEEVVENDEGDTCAECGAMVEVSGEWEDGDLCWQCASEKVGPLKSQLTAMTAERDELSKMNSKGCDLLAIAYAERNAAQVDRDEYVEALSAEQNECVRLHTELERVEAKYDAITLIADNHAMGRINLGEERDQLRAEHVKCQPMIVSLQDRLIILLKERDAARAELSEFAEAAHRFREQIYCYSTGRSALQEEDMKPLDEKFVRLLVEARRKK